jgi:hypothetical protein
VAASRLPAIRSQIGRRPAIPEFATRCVRQSRGQRHENYRTMVRGLGLTDARISPSHSWRHRFKTLARRHGLMPDIVNALTGHHQKTVADAYGEFQTDALYIRQGANGCGHHDASADDLRKRSLSVRILALLAPWIASCSSGSISALQVGHRSLQRQSHSSHQFVPQGQVWCFRNHGISVVLIQTRARGHRGFRDRLLAGRRTVREARPMTRRSGTVVATRAAGEACAPLRHAGG